MKRFIIVLLGVLFLCVMGAFHITQAATEKTAQQRQQNMDVIRGKITKIDKKKKEIGIRASTNGEEKTFFANSKILKGLKIDEEVRVKLQPGTQVVTSIMVVKKHQKVSNK